MNLNERFNRLDEFIAEDRLVRKMWGDGQARACLLLAIAPEVGVNGAVDRCPADVIPPWLAELTPCLDDNGTKDAWPTMIRRYSIVVRRGAETLDDAGWRRVLARTMIVVLAGAAPHDPSGSCQRVSTLWLRVLAGDEPLKEEWAVAAVAEEWAAAGAAAWAARRAAAAEAAWAAGGVAEAVAAAAWARSAAAEAAGFPTTARTASTWDRITGALLDGIEIECGVSREETK